MRHLFILICIFINACGNSATPAAAESTMRLYLYNIMDPQAESLTAEQVVEVVRWVSDRYEKATGHPIALAVYEEVQASEVMPGIDLFNPDNYAQSRRLEAFIGWLGMTKRWHHDAFQYGMLPPMSCNGMKCFGGMAHFGCEYPGGAVGIGQAAEWSSHVPPRLRIPAGSSIPVAHEMGHGVKMLHHSIEDGFEPNLMDQAAGRFVDSIPNLCFLPLSADEMGACIVKTREYRITRCRRLHKGHRRRKKSCVRRAKGWLALRSGDSSDIVPVFE